MYIEKNICDNLIGILLNLDGQSKDNKMAQKDCMEMGSMHELHRISRPNQKTYIPLTYYTLSNSEKTTFLQVLKDLKVPDRYSSNIKI